MVNNSQFNSAKTQYGLRSVQTSQTSSLLSLSRAIRVYEDLFIPRNLFFPSVILDRKLILSTPNTTFSLNLLSPQPLCPHSRRSERPSSRRTLRAWARKRSSSTTKWRKRRGRTPKQSRRRERRRKRRRRRSRRERRRVWGRRRRRELRGENEVSSSRGSDARPEEIEFGGEPGTQPLQPLPSHLLPLPPHQSRPRPRPRPHQLSSQPHHPPHHLHHTLSSRPPPPPNHQNLSLIRFRPPPPSPPPPPPPPPLIPPTHHHSPSSTTLQKKPGGTWPGPLRGPWSRGLGDVTGCTGWGMRSIWRGRLLWIRDGERGRGGKGRGWEELYTCK